MKKMGNYNRDDTLDLRDRAKALILLLLLDGNVEFTPYLHLWKIGSVEIVKTWDKSCVFLLY